MRSDILKEIKKLNFTAPPVIAQTENWKETVREVKSFIERRPDESLVQRDSSEFQLQSSELPPSRFYTDIRTAHMECFFKKGSLDYLVVFFSGARTRAGGRLAPYPTFSSWSWYKDINASVLCIDDPTYKTFPKMEIGWYYGTQTEDYRYDISLLIKKIAALLGVPLTALVERREAPLPQNLRPVRARRIPLLGTIAAGEPIFAEEEHETYVDVDGSARADFALEVKGESMEPVYKDGDVVYIRRQDDVLDGQVAAVVVDDSATLKRVYHLPVGVQLMPLNPAFAPMLFTPENSDSVRILGLAVGYFRKTV